MHTAQNSPVTCKSVRFSEQPRGVDKWIFHGLGEGISCPLRRVNSPITQEDPEAGLSHSPPLSTSERRWNIFQGLKGFYLKEHLSRFEGFYQNLAVTVLYVPYSLASSTQVVRSVFMPRSKCRVIKLKLQGN